MKIKHFIAPNTSQAMSQIRAELGDDAIIISTETISDGVRVTAAVEDSNNIDFDSKDNLEITPSLQVYDDVLIRESLEYHDVVTDVAGQILAVSRQHNAQSGIADNHELLARTLKQMYSFASIFETDKNCKIFLGAPGCGKSTVIAKVAAQAKLKKIKTSIISTDNVRAGANRQLEAFSEILDTNFCFCKNAKELFSQIHNTQTLYDLILVDTPGINPYVEEEVRRVDELIDSIKANKILVQDAGRNTLEAIETAEIFSRLGAEYILPTHLDMTRRIGSVISSAYCSHLGFCSGSVSSNIAKGLADVTPVSLARLLLAE